MDFLPYNKSAKLLELAERIKHDIQDWQIIEVGLMPETAQNAPFIARQLQEYFSGKDGAVFISNQDILVIVNLGKDINLNAVPLGIKRKMPQYDCAVFASGITGDGLLKLQIKIKSLRETRGKQEQSHLFKARTERKEPAIMIVEDDMFTRSVIANTFETKGRVIELGSAEQVVNTYLENLPDVLFLDIHLPGGSGMDVLAEILTYDESAYVIIISSDSIKGNVLAAQKLGARGFIAKNFTAAKLEEAYSKCPTIASRQGARK